MTEDSSSRSGRSPRRILLAVLPLALLVVVGIGALVKVVLNSSPPATPGAGTGPGGGSLVIAAGEKPESVLSDAKQALRNQKPLVAEALLKEASERWPSDQQVRLSYGETLLALGKLEASYEQYALAIAIGPDRAEYRFNAGSVAVQAGMLEQAEGQYQLARQLDLSNPQYPLYLAQVQRKLGHNEKARANLVIAAKLDPNLAVAWGTLAAIALDENRPEMGLDYVKKARKLEPDLLVWRVLEAKLLRRDNRPREAVELLMAVPEFERLSDASVLEELASSLGMQGKPGEAAAAYIKASDLATENMELAYQAAVWLERDKQIDRGLAYAKRAAMGGHEGARALLARLEGSGSKAPNSK